MTSDIVYYAIGDIHGELSRLQQLHRDIRNYHDAQHPHQPRYMIHLGDYVDRGPDSAGVIDYLTALEASDGDNMICLKGNHEVMMVDAMRHGRKMDWWCGHGGTQTLESYSVRNMDSPSEEHLDWLDQLPTRHHDPARKLVFVHAAIDADIFPEPDAHQHLWGRSAAFFNSASWRNPALDGYCVIHGHTPTDDQEPDISEDRRRINVDTGAVYGGALTAVGLATDRPPIFLKA